jgi:hypothetical protein
MVTQLIKVVERIGAGVVAKAIQNPCTGGGGYSYVLPNIACTRRRFAACWRWETRFQVFYRRCLTRSRGAGEAYR